MLCKRVYNQLSKHFLINKNYSAIASVLQKQNIGEDTEIKVIYDIFLLIQGNKFFLPNDK